MIYTQLIRYLERRPEKYSAEGSRNIQTLLLMDEFARFGKLEIITAAMATLRSKCVNICLIIQSIAQLDKIYGERDRRIICDNAQYKVVLNANDPDTQQYFANLIGTRIFRKYSMSEFQNESREPTGYSSQVSESRELLIQPYEFATLKKAVVLTPYGACLLEKFYINSQMANEQLLPAFGTHPARPSVDMDPSLKFISSESGSRMLTAAERTENARRHAREALNHPEEDGQETKQAVEREAFIQSIAGFVLQRFPQLWDLEAGFQAEDADWYRPLEYILKRLADNQALLDEMKHEAGWPPSSGTNM